MSEESSPTGSTSRPLTTADAREVMLHAIGDYSESHWAAGWLTGIEDVVRRHGRGWVLLAWLAGGWPRGLDGEDGWAPLTEDEEQQVLRFLHGRLDARTGDVVDPRRP